MRRIISVLIENEAGSLSRLVGLFAQRGYNIETLTVAPTEDETLSRLTMTTLAGDEQVEQITKQLNKLLEVVKLVDLTEGEYVERELMLIKVAPKLFERMCNNLRSTVAGIRTQERRLLNLCVRQAGMPRKDFLANFQQNETVYRE